MTRLGAIAGSLAGNPSEHMPAPKVGDSYRAGEDWRRWYPSELVIPGVHAEDKIDVAYAGDLKGLMIVDEISKAGSFYDSAKHHQQYQEFLQSHFKKNIMSCNDCHSAHAAKDGKVISAKDTCANCHDATFTVEKYMPGTGVTVQGLLLRTHTFNKNQTRTTKGVVASGEPEYQNKK